MFLVNNSYVCNEIKGLENCVLYSIKVVAIKIIGNISKKISSLMVLKLMGICVYCFKSKNVRWFVPHNQQTVQRLS